MKALALLALVAGCGDDGGGGGGKAIDAAQHQDGAPGDGKPIDGKPADAAPPDGPTNVVNVTCPATPDASVTINAGGTAYSPPVTTITVNQIVKFTTESVHDVFPDANACVGCVADPGIHVDFSKTECKQFLTVGKYGFHCSFHGFEGSVVVQAPPP